MILFLGWPGSMHDARVFRRSALCNNLRDNIYNIHPEMHLIGDSAYTLTNHLLVPYKDNGRLNDRQKIYNEKLSKNRVSIEHAFGLLKGRFRCLQNLQVYKTEYIPKIILACCILHNLCIDQNDCIPILLDEPEGNNGPNVDLGNQDNGGVEKRNYISSIL